MKRITEPAVVIGALATLLAGIASAIENNTTNGQLNAWQAALVILPLLAAFVTRTQVVPVSAIEGAVEKGRSVVGILTEILSRVGISLPSTPIDSNDAPLP